MLLLWDERFLRLAYHISRWSKDRSSKCGAVLVRDRRVLSTGYNGFPAGLDDDNDEYHERPMKYYLTEHAERNMLFSAARHGVSTAGTTAYVYGMKSCAPCMRAMALSGVELLVCGWDSDEKPDGTSHAMDEEDFKAGELIADYCIGYSYKTYPMPTSFWIAH